MTAARPARRHRLRRSRHDGPSHGVAPRRALVSSCVLFDLSQKAVSDFVGAHPSALATASVKAAAAGRRCFDYHAARRQGRAARGARRPTTP